MIKRLRTRFFPAIVLAAVLGAIAALVAAADTIDPSATGARYAWGENVGWINAEAPINSNPTVTAGVTVSGTKLTGYMWGENIGWINMNCSNNATCGGPAPNWGVTNDGAGNLSGYAWAENVGWISFSCRNTSPTCVGPSGSWGVTINPLTGLFGGKAYGENIGWVVFDYTTQTANRAVTNDGDGVAQASDNCQFDANPTQTNTDFAVAWPWIKDGAPVPEGTSLGGDACDLDRDNDGCPNAKESGGAAVQGGVRDPALPWDFFDAPVPALLPGQTSGVRNKGINLADVLAVLSYVGTQASQPNTANGAGAKYGTDLNANGVIDGQEYDRTPSTNPSELWHSGAPNGGVSIQDALVGLAQVGTNCN